MKLLGSLCILLSCGWLLLRWQKNQREEQLLRRCLLEKLQDTEQTALNFGRPLPEIFRGYAVAGDCCAPFFAALCRSLAAEPEYPLAYHWTRSLRELPEPLQPLLQSLAQALDAEGETLQKALRLTAEELRHFDRERRKLQPQRQQLQTTLYVSAAALLIILLL